MFGFFCAVSWLSCGLCTASQRQAVLSPARDLWRVLWASTGFCGPSPWPVDEAHMEGAPPALRGICIASGAVGAVPACVLLPMAMFNDGVLETHRGSAPRGRGLALLPRDLSTGIGSQLRQGSGAGVSRLSHAVGYVKLNYLTKGTPTGDS